jgi:hypothetical protein
VEHSACVKQFSVELQTKALTGECAKVVDAARVIEEQSRFCISRMNSVISLASLLSGTLMPEMSAD